MNTSPRSSSATARIAAAPAGPDVQRFIRDALEDRLLAGDIPDIGVAGGSKATRLYVRADMPALKMRLTTDALPQLPGVMLTLISLAGIKEIVARTGERVTFVTIDRAQLGNGRATIRLGADYIAPEEPGMIKLCCCESEALFLRRDERWVFETWGAGRCS